MRLKVRFLWPKGVTFRNLLTHELTLPSASKRASANLESVWLSSISWEHTIKRPKNMLPTAIIEEPLTFHWQLRSGIQFTGVLLFQTMCLHEDP